MHSELYRILVLSLTSVVFGATMFAQVDAERRAAKLGIGMNLSYLDNFWKGTREKHFSDFAKPEEAAKREEMLVDISKAGFKTVRLPICFSAWMELKQPYNWDTPDVLKRSNRFMNRLRNTGSN